MNKQLKISADTSAIKKSILDLANMVKKDLGKSQIQLFTKESDRLIKGEAASALKEINKISANIKDQITRQNTELNKTAKGTKQYRSEVEKLLKLQKELFTVEKDRADLTRIAKSGATTNLGGLIQQKGSLAGGGFGGMLGRLGKFITNPWVAGAALATGAGAYGFSRAQAGLQKFREAVPTRLALRGRGINNFGLSQEEKETAAMYGVSKNELERQRLRAINIFGRRGADIENQLRRARFELGKGLEPGTLLGIGAQITPQLGGRRAEESLFKLQASLISSGIDDRIGPYLESAANMLTQLNENGLSNNAEVLAALAGLTKETGQAPEIISKRLIGLDQAIKTSSGERNAFMQVAFAKAGIGGGTIGGTQMAIETGGLFGADFSRLPKQWQKNLEKAGMGKSTGFQNRAKALLAQLSRSVNINPTNPQETIELGRMAKNVLHMPNAGVALESVNLLKKAISGGDTKEIIKQLKELQKDPQLKFLEGIKKSIENQVKYTETMRDTLSTELGNKVAPASIAMRQSLNHVDEKVTDIADSLMRVFSNIPGFKPLSKRLSNAQTGKSTLNKEDLIYTSPESQRNLRKGMTKNLKNIQSKISTLDKEIQDTPGFFDAIRKSGQAIKLHEREQNLKESIKLIKEELPALTPKKYGPMNPPGGGEAWMSNQWIDNMTKGAVDKIVSAINDSSKANIEHRGHINQKRDFSLPLIKNPKTYGDR